CLDSIYTDLGQIVYVQHPALNRAVGGRILTVYSDGIQLDKPVVMLGTGLVGHWRLNDCAADTDVVDSSGNGCHFAAARHTAQISTPGKIGQCLAFNGSSDSLIRAPSSAFATLTGSVCAWIKPSSVSGSYAIFASCDEGSTTRFFHFGQHTSYLVYQAANGGTTDNIRTDAVLTAGVWHHVVLTGDGTTIRCYVNGVEKPFTYAYSGSNAGRWIGGVDSRDNVTVGVLKRTASERWFPGLIDDVRVYNRALSVNEILALYNRGFGTEEEGAADHALLVRTHDGTAERLNLYEVASVSGPNLDVITINGAWEYTPNENDLATFGVEAKVIDLYRVKAIERDGAGRVLIRGTQYTTDFYSEDEDAPKVQAQVYSQTKGGRSPTLLPTTAEAIKASRPDGSSTLDTLTWGGLTFTGNGVDTVAWACTGSGIKYQGVWVPIENDAVGTTDKYIYFDPNAGDPRYLQHTDDLADLRGQERFLMCLNVAGVAYPKGGMLIGADGKAIDADDLADGSR
ncbi:MAG TPA: LamG domain-containing protein, partial [Phycisphaerae bacterium]|nr:LamG domain-containing protein [Phycisphaerae bacterium]